MKNVLLLNAVLLVVCATLLSLNLMRANGDRSPRLPDQEIQLGQPSAYTFPLPDSLVALLLQARQPDLLENATLERVQELRKNLVSEINPLHPAVRDSLAREIAQANLVLEILELHASPDVNPDDALISLTTIEALREGDFNGLADAYKEYLDKREVESAAVLLKQLQEFAQKLASSSTPLDLPEGELARVSLFSIVAADALDDNDEPALWIPDLAGGSVAWLKESGKLKEPLGELLPGSNWMLAAGEVSQQGVELLSRCQSLGQHTLATTIRKELDALEQLNKQAQAAAWKKYQLQSLDTIDFALSLGGDGAAKRWEAWLSAARSGDAKELKNNCMRRALAEFPKFRGKVNGLCATVDLSDADKARNLTEASAKRISDCLYQVVGWKDTKALMELLNRDLIVHCLLPIDITLLDEPVARLHGKTFQSAWAHLEATTLQRGVAGESATVEKQSIYIPAEPWTP